MVRYCKVEGMTLVNLVGATDPRGSKLPKFRVVRAFIFRIVIMDLARYLGLGFFGGGFGVSHSIYRV